jgi:maltooligosyltrehalose trehalohydrolase
MVDQGNDSVTQPQGAMQQDDGSFGWRVWAPCHQQVQLVTWKNGERREQPMTREAHGYFSATCSDAVAAGLRYAYRLGDEALDFPDPASRWQPDGVHAPSAVWHPDRFAWSDSGWTGVSRDALVIYELHVGTFTPDGTFEAIIPRLAELAELGITAIEIMPIAQFPGVRDWGYDGVFWFAAQNSYGGPAGLERLVDACHAQKMAVILDVVYNHLGPEGNYTGAFGPYASERYHTPWGGAINFDDRDCDAVRALVLQNVRQWIRDFHIDGLRLDAVHSIFDNSPRHILAEIALAVHEEADRAGRKAQVIAESNLNDVRLLDPLERGGYALDGQWSDDFHHCVHGLLTGEHDGYYSDFKDPPRQLAASLERTFVYDGRYSVYRKRRHGAPAKSHPGDCFVVNIQTHDQVGNRALGERLHELVDLPRQRLGAGLMLLAPYMPMLFMGEEYGERARFPFFCDFGDPELREAVRRGRREEFRSFSWQGEIPDPQAEATFASAVLAWKWPEETGQAGLRRLYHDLLRLRREHPALRDFTHRVVELRDVEGVPAVLRLVRGSDADDARVEICYNLSSNTVPLPACGLHESGVLLDSTDPRFGTCGGQTTSAEWLSPFAFVVRGPNLRRKHGGVDHGRAT